MTGIASRKLRHRVRIEQQTQTQDPNTGAMVTAWVLYAERWADYTPQSVREFIAASSTQSEVRGRFIFRHDDGIVSEMRVIHRGKQYAILGVMPDPESGLEYDTAAVSEGVLVV
jgi:SPP1 family predicted phage head-tail adaptor